MSFLCSPLKSYVCTRRVLSGSLLRRNLALHKAKRRSNEASNTNNEEKTYHVPVMVKECLDYLNIQKDGCYIDCTMGGGGHSLAILEKGGKVIGLDQDPDAIKETSKRLQSYIEEGRMEIIQTNFRNLATIPSRSKILNGSLADGILMDLGISSHQIDESARGFSFSGKGPLDMRMHQGNVVDNNNHKSPLLTAKEIVNSYGAEELANILYYYGEETRSRSIAREIIVNRPLNTTEDLEKVISRVCSYKDRPKILARCFQALRIYINDELGALEQALESAEGTLRLGGRLVILSYHSLEDRRVKQLFKLGKIIKQSEGEEKEAEFNTNDEDDVVDKDVQRRKVNWKVLVKRGLGPSAQEIELNKRSRSAKLRAAERIDADAEETKDRYPKFGKKQLRKMQLLQEEEMERENR